MGKAPNHPQKNPAEVYTSAGRFIYCSKSLIQRELRSQIGNALGNIVLLACKVKDAVCDAVRNHLHLVNAHAAGRHGGGANAHAAGHKGAALLAGHGVLVGGDVYLVQVVLQLLAGYRKLINVE